MQIKPEQLSARLKKDATPLVWISGDDTLLVQEACDTVRGFARAQGFTEREVIDAGSHFDWNQLLAAGNSLSLFAERKLIDLRLGAAKLDEAARTALLAYLDNPNPDNLLLLTTARIDKAAQGTKWFKSLESKGLFCPVWPVSEQQLPQWLRERLQRHELTADEDALKLLAERVEGNLLAAAQEVEKLHLVAASSHIDLKTVLTAVADSSRFNAFTLVDACLAGNSARALRILGHLQAEGAEILFLLNRLCSEIRTLAAMRTETEQGRSITAVLQTWNVWSSRTSLVGGALQRHDRASLQNLLEKARVVDQSVKGLLDCRPWDELADLVLGLSNPRLLVGMV
jgi:DNA polymerase-3 subunit delta